MNLKKRIHQNNTANDYEYNDQSICVDTNIDIDPDIRSIAVEYGVPKDKVNDWMSGKYQIPADTEKEIYDEAKRISNMTADEFYGYTPQKHKKRKSNQQHDINSDEAKPKFPKKY